MIRTIRLALLPIITIVVLAGCATVPSDFEQPKITVTSFKPLSRGSLTPEFEIVLRVTNPNRTALEVEGISYSIDLDGNEVMSGVSNNLPNIPAYGESEVKLRATANLMGGFKVLTGMMNQYKDQVDYAFHAKLDVGAFTPSIRVSKQGVFSLTGK